MICREIPLKTLSDEIDRLKRLANDIPPGKSYTRRKCHAAIAALEWIKDGKLPPSVIFQ